MRLATGFDLASAKLEADERHDYGEARYIAVGFLGAVLYTLTFTPRGGRLRAISLRKANRQERQDYRDFYGH